MGGCTRRKRHSPAPPESAVPVRSARNAASRPGLRYRHRRNTRPAPNSHRPAARKASAPRRRAPAPRQETKRAAAPRRKRCLVRGGVYQRFDKLNWVEQRRRVLFPCTRRESERLIDGETDHRHGRKDNCHRPRGKYSAPTAVGERVAKLWSRAHNSPSVPAVASCLL